MKLVDLFFLVMRNFFEKRGRVFLTISGIVLGIFTFTFFVFLSQGLSNAIYEQFSSFGVNVLAVRPYSSSSGSPGGDGLLDRDISDIGRIVKNEKYIAPGIFNSLLVSYGKQSEVIVSVGYPGDLWKYIKDDIGIEMESGRFLKRNDRNVVVIGSKVANDLFDKKINKGTSIKIREKSFRVIGVIKERGDLFIDSSILMNLDDIKDLTGQETYSVIRISFNDGADLNFMKEAILRKLNPNSQEKRVVVTSPEQVMEKFNEILGILTMIITFISSVSLLVGGINVMNTMYSNVIERINEISVLKAIGARNSEIVSLFLIESSFLGFIGALIGFISSFLLAKTISLLIINFTGYFVPVYWNWPFFYLVLFLTTIFSMFFGTYPSYLASRINPSENLRDE